MTGRVLTQFESGAASLSADNYRDPARYQREIEHVLLRSWLVVCPSAELDKARDFVVWERLGQSVLVVRLDDTGLAAWHNVCQHRGSRLVNDAAGTCSLGAFRCPNHGFSYDLEGRVVHVPLREEFDPAELEGLRAPQVRVAEWGGWIWLNLTLDAPELIDSLGELVPELAWYKFQDWDARYSRSWPVEANWKSVLDGFNEVWHVPFVHRTSVRGGLMWRQARIQVLGAHSMLTLPLRDRASDDAEFRHHEHAVCHYLAFPNATFNCFPDHVHCVVAWPVDVHTTVLSVWGLTAPRPDGTTPEAWEERCDREWAHFCRVVDEDVDILNAAGVVQQSRGFTRNLFNISERRLTAFHATLDRLTEGAALGDQIRNDQPPR